MDDLAGKISEILNDPASMEKIKNLSNMLGIAPDSQDSSPTGQTAPAAPQNANPLEALLGSLGGNGQGAGGDLVVKGLVTDQITGPSQLTGAAFHSPSARLNSSLPDGKLLIRNH